MEMRAKGIQTRDRPMNRTATSILLVMVLACVAVARDWNIRFSEDYDPRQQIRLVVMPTQISTKLKRVEPRTVSALLSTELLREYDVLDLTRFEKYLADRKLSSLEQAFSVKGQPVVIDSASLDAITNIEVYRWDEGVAGNILSAQKGSIGVRVTLTEPYSGTVLWSINLLDKVKGGSDFLVAITGVFRDLVSDLQKENERLAKRLDKQDELAAKALDKEADRLAREREKEEEERERERLAEEKRQSQILERVAMAEGSMFKDIKEANEAAPILKEFSFMTEPVVVDTVEVSTPLPFYYQNGEDKAVDRVERRRRRPTSMSKPEEENTKATSVKNGNSPG